ncbi:glycylpeptide N-tetradecanoyltransferase [Saitozyma podzolica]|uniref:Glycylpeptide N-tetradecanoyltransferase n=1 Tax=Saitozyma podzolica TaxID=1890683 RepID=A0A427YI34_9TREE|nr:glycylpeptide N-tetradecanoyltransferase [Saitozyma podzolica]
MPVPPDESVPADAPSSSSHSGAAAAIDDRAAAQEVLEKFKQLGREAQEEGEGEGEGDGSDEEDDDEEGAHGEGGATGAGGAEGGAGGDESGKKKKKKKKKGKASKAVAKLKSLTTGAAPQELVDQIRENMEPAEQNAATDEEIRKALKAVDLMKILDGQVALGGKSGTKALGEHKVNLAFALTAAIHARDFWKTQPVPQLPTPDSAPNAVEEGPIDPVKTPSEVKQDPGALPSGFVWSQIDIMNDEQCDEVHTLLSENYVEDDEAMFRFRYSKEFLLWALTAPGYLPQWHIGVRVAKTGKLVAFISGIKVDIRVRAKTFESAEINFLCVHKKLRSKRLAPVLIKEVTRQCNLANVWQAIYTAGVVLPTPFGTSRYFHRNLNPPKLVDIGFAHLPRTSTISRMVRQYAVPQHPRIPGFREMVKADVPQVGELLRKYLARFEVVQVFAKDEEVEHWFLSGQGREEGGKRVEQVVWAYVVELSPIRKSCQRLRPSIFDSSLSYLSAQIETGRPLTLVPAQDPTTHLITDFISFYSLPSSIMKHKKHDVLNAAYLFYYASDAIFQPGGSSDEAAHEAKSKSRLGERLNALVGDMMVVAKNAGFDVLNALTLLDNNMFLNEQKFGPGDGFLNYYLYNWSCAPIDGGAKGTTNRESSGIGMVML